MVKPKTLKEENSKMVTGFFLLNVALFSFISLVPLIEFLEVENKEDLFARGAGIFIVPLILFVVNGIISSNQKAILCFWRINNPLPACRAFSYYVDKDFRIDKTQLISQYGDLPENPKDQNSLWYKIYKTHQNDPPVKKSHKDFLLGKDLCSMSFLFLLIGGVTMLFLTSGISLWFYIGYLVFQYIVLALVAQNHGKRFICNSLSIETSKVI